MNATKTAVAVAMTADFHTLGETVMKSLISVAPLGDITNIFFFYTSYMFL